MLLNVCHFHHKCHHFLMVSQLWTLLRYSCLYLGSRIHEFCSIAKCLICDLTFFSWNYIALLTKICVMIFKFHESVLNNVFTKFSIFEMKRWKVTHSLYFATFQIWSYFQTIYLVVKYHISQGPRKLQKVRGAKHPKKYEFLGFIAFLCDIFWN